ncbi:phage terminase large subunit [Spartinivicinus poritis]|uniref:Phage terminase large subunit n=1 Tax=Spartinivicinus poritis TaxID=2994640 RepID=A0ABT5U6W1_9GAMM|nr:phage terminase large subunit [Spartinivicinus sp. A2-2]MDE1462099.1 phage terminase large subunit [Spartinivicinus sp. A2-2]
MNQREKELEHQLKTEFVFFLTVIWKYLRLPPPTELQKDIALYLQEGPKRKIIMGFRGVAKSWITSAYVLWRLYKNPQVKVLVVSASKERADSFSTFTKRLIDEIPFLNHLKPRRDQRDSKIAFDVGPAAADHSPSVKSVGITGQLTGSRADIIVADDIEVLNNSATQTARDKLAELVKEFDAILKPLASSEITFLGTPQTEMSLYNKLVKERGYKVRIWTALYPNPDEIEKWKGNLSSLIYDKVIRNASLAGTTTEPSRFPDSDLAERRLSYGKAGFALQFMLDTSLSDADKYPLKLADLMVMSLDLKRAPIDLAWCNSADKVLEVPTLGLTGDRFYSPMWTDKELAEYTGSVMFIDPSGRGADETSYAVAKFLHGYQFLIDVGGYRDGYTPTTLQELANTAQQHKVNMVQVEDNFGDGMFIELFKPILRKVHSCQVEGKRAKGQKEKRIIDSLEPVMSQHRLIVDTRIIEKDYKECEGDFSYSLFYQMSRITHDRGALKHDDRLEAVAGAVAYWVEQMALDGAVEAERHRAEALEAEFEKFAEDCLGFKSKLSSWVK